MIRPDVTKYNLLEGALIAATGYYSYLKLEKGIVDSYRFKMDRLFQSNLPTHIHLAKSKKIQQQVKRLSRLSPIPGVICGILFVGGLRRIRNQVIAENRLD